MFFSLFAMSHHCLPVWMSVRPYSAAFIHSSILCLFAIRFCLFFCLFPVLFYFILHCSCSSSSSSQLTHTTESGHVAVAGRIFSHVHYLSCRQFSKRRRRQRLHSKTGSSVTAEQKKTVTLEKINLACCLVSAGKFDLFTFEFVHFWSFWHLFKLCATKICYSCYYCFCHRLKIVNWTAFW